ncbi:MAG: hypothetical protein OXF98_08890 [Rhodospirillaceae bacterium]|nr:hypothetical protein [Rhodospirillaceae bacterium]
MGAHRRQAGKVRPCLEAVREHRRIGQVSDLQPVPLDDGRLTRGGEVDAGANGAHTHPGEAFNHVQHGLGPGVHHVVVGHGNDIEPPGRKGRQVGQGRVGWNGGGQGNARVVRITRFHVSEKDVGIVQGRLNVFENTYRVVPVHQQVARQAE